MPLLAAVRPNGERSIEELEAAGGALAVMKQLEGLLDADARTLTGETVGDSLAGARVLDTERPARGHQHR